VAPFSYVSLIWAALFGWLLFSEWPTPGHGWVLPSSLPAAFTFSIAKTA